MKVLKIVNFPLAVLLLFGISSTTLNSNVGVNGIPPSTYGTFVDSFGRITNSIKVKLSVPSSNSINQLIKKKSVTFTQQLASYYIVDVFINSAINTIMHHIQVYLYILQISFLMWFLRLKSLHKAKPQLTMMTEEKTPLLMM